MRQSNSRQALLSRKVWGLCAATAVIWFGASGLSGQVTGSDVETTAREAGDEKASELPEEPPYKKLTQAQLRRKLSRIQYEVTQREGTERAFQNRYWNNKQNGLYECLVCARPLFESKTKYKSGTGWPSFYAPIHEDAVGYKQDWKLFVTRTEVHCGRCESHLGHVFNDGPRPTGKRYCMNSASLKFISEAEMKRRAEKKAEQKDSESESETKTAE